MRAWRALLRFLGYRTSSPYPTLTAYSIEVATLMQRQVNAHRAAMIEFSLGDGALVRGPRIAFDDAKLHVRLHEGLLSGRDPNLWAEWAWTS